MASLLQSPPFVLFSISKVHGDKDSDSVEGSGKGSG